MKHHVADVPDVGVDAVVRELELVHQDVAGLSMFLTAATTSGHAATPPDPAIARMLT